MLGRSQGLQSATAPATPLALPKFYHLDGQMSLYPFKPPISPSGLWPVWWQARFRKDDLFIFCLSIRRDSVLLAQAQSRVNKF